MINLENEENEETIKEEFIVSAWNGIWNSNFSRVLKVIFSIWFIIAILVGATFIIMFITAFFQVLSGVKN